MLYFRHLLFSHVCNEASNTGDTDTAAAGGTRVEEKGWGKEEKGQLY